MEMKVFVGTEEEFQAAYEATQRTTDKYGEAILNRLQEALEHGEKEVSFRSFEPLPAKSINFQFATVMEKTILEFIKQHEDVDMIVSIVCKNEEIDELYKVAYNFWFAAEKSERMMKEDW